MPVPAPWPATLKQCKTLEASFDKELKYAAAAKVGYLAKEKLYEAQRYKVCATAGYDLKKGGEGATRKKAEEAMLKDPVLNKLGPEIEALREKSAPDLNVKDKLKKELQSYEKMLKAPDLTGLDGKGKGLPADILKAYKDGMTYIANTKKKFGIK